MAKTVVRDQQTRIRSSLWLATTLGLLGCAMGGPSLEAIDIDGPEAEVELQATIQEGATVPVGSYAGLYAYVFNAHTYNGTRPTNFGTRGNPPFDGERAFRSAYLSSHAQGITIIGHWDKVNPAINQYDWTDIDYWVSNAVREGKKIAIGIVGGERTPAWVDVPRVFYRSAHRTTLNCVDHEVAVPWFATYRSRYIVMMRELARHLRQDRIANLPIGAAYNHVRMVKIAGINMGNIETRLNRTQPRDRTHCPRGPFADDVWASSNATDGKPFTVSRVVATWNQLASGIGAAFPNKALAFDVVRGAFPPSGGNQPSTNRIFDEATNQIIEAAMNSTALGDRIHVQWDGLSSLQASNPVLREVKALSGGQHGFQVNQYQGQNGAGCVRNDQFGPCNNTLHLENLRNGIRFGARYIEVHLYNVMAHDASLVLPYRYFDRL